MWKNTCKCLQKKFHRTFQIYLTPHIHVPEANWQLQLKMSHRQHKRSSSNFLTTLQRVLISLKCQLLNSGSSVWNYILFWMRLCCAFFFHFQQRIFVKQGFPARRLSSINTDIDVLWKIFFDVLCKDCPENLWSREKVAIPTFSLTLAFCAYCCKK